MQCSGVFSPSTQPLREQRCATSEQSRVLIDMSSIRFANLICLLDESKAPVLIFILSSTHWVAARLPFQTALLCQCISLVLHIADDTLGVLVELFGLVLCRTFITFPALVFCDSQQNDVIL